MKHKSYLIETMPAGNTDIDHVKDVCCTVCRNGIEAGRFTVTQNELGEYDSLEKAVRAYMQRDYPDNTRREEARYRRMRKAETRLQKRQRALLTAILRRNGGRVTSYPVPDEDGGVEYPVTMTCSGKYGNPNISITDVHLDEHGELYVDGIDESTGAAERNYPVCPEQYSWTLAFLGIALGFRKRSPLSEFLSRLKERFHF